MKAHASLFAVVLGLAALPPLSVAQTKPKPKPPTPKPSATAPTKGTAQLPGDNGKLGVTYQLGGKDQELHFTLESAQIAPFYKSPEETVIAKADQRLLVLTFTVHNPQKARDMTVNFGSFQFTAVSPDDKNFVTNGSLYQPESLRRYQGDLKPAQKVKVQVVLPIYAAGPVRKIIVQRGPGAVLRYDLEGKLLPAKTSFSPDGFDFVNEFTGEVGKPFDVSAVEAEVQEVASHQGNVGNYKRYQDRLIFTVQVKYTNLLSRPLLLNWNTLKPTLLDENGEKMGWETDMISLGTGSSISQEVAPGESIRGLLIFKGQGAQKPAKLRLLEPSSGRTATFAISETVKK
ncbi:MAG: hypothetical protein ACOYON_04195 [Fimbriimonas sp.]